MEQQRSNNRLHIPCMHLTVFKLGAEGRSLHRNSDPSLQTRAAWNLHEETEEDDKLFEEQIESMIAGIMGPEESFGYSSTVRAKSEILTFDDARIPGMVDEHEVDENPKTSDVLDTRLELLENWHRP